MPQSEYKLGKTCIHHINTALLMFLLAYYKGLLKVKMSSYSFNNSLAWLGKTHSFSSKLITESCPRLLTPPALSFLFWHEATSPHSAKGSRVHCSQTVFAGPLSFLPCPPCFLAFQRDLGLNVSGLALELFYQNTFIWHSSFEDRWVYTRKVGERHKVSWLVETERAKQVR